MKPFKNIMRVFAVIFVSCGNNENTAGAVIDTSTINAQVQGRSVASLYGEWLTVEDDAGVVDSIQIKEDGSLYIEYEPNNGLRLITDSLSYFAYRIIPTDTIRPSASLRFLFPFHEEWNNQNPPQIIGWEPPLTWSEVHNVWTIDSLPAGRHLIRWTKETQTYQADLILNEMANRFEPHQMTASIPAGSLRPKNCGWGPILENIEIPAGWACPHTESDAFNKSGISSADLFVWTDSVLRFQLVTLMNDGMTKNPYSKLMLEFDSKETSYELNNYDSVTINMNLLEGDCMEVRLAQKNIPVGHWYYYQFEGLGKGKYTMPLDTSLLALNKTSQLDLSQIFGLEFRNAQTGRAILAEVYSIRFH